MTAHHFIDLHCSRPGNTQIIYNNAVLFMVSRKSGGNVKVKSRQDTWLALGIERLTDEAGSMARSRSCSHGKPVSRPILPDEFVHEQDVDPASEVRRWLCRES
jgi:hypothetical protein